VETKYDFQHDFPGDFVKYIFHEKICTLANTVSDFKIADLTIQSYTYLSSLIVPLEYLAPEEVSTMILNTQEKYYQALNCC